LTPPIAVRRDEIDPLWIHAATLPSRLLIVRETRTSCVQTSRRRVAGKTRDGGLRALSRRIRSFPAFWLAPQPAQQRRGGDDLPGVAGRVFGRMEQHADDRRRQLRSADAARLQQRRFSGRGELFERTAYRLADGGRQFV